MCKISNYPDLYMKTVGILREEGINPTVPGYELLRKALIIYKINGPGPNFFEEVRMGRVIPASEVKKSRTPEEQWMVEAIKMKNINIPLMEYIKRLSERLWHIFS